jgi:hypothetical protein
MELSSHQQNNKADDHVVRKKRHYRETLTETSRKGKEDYGQSTEHARFQVLMVAGMKMTAFWDTELWS